MFVRRLFIYRLLFLGTTNICKIYVKRENFKNFIEDYREEKLKYS